MDPIAFLEQFGIPLSVAVVFGYFIWQQNSYIQKDLNKDLKSQFMRQEKIIVTLISQIKAAQLDLKELKGYVEGIEDILTKLTGNGLKGKK
jgi:hypothetical protein